MSTKKNIYYDSDESNDWLDDCLSDDEQVNNFPDTSFIYNQKNLLISDILSKKVSRFDSNQLNVLVNAIKNNTYCFTETDFKNYLSTLVLGKSYSIIRCCNLPQSMDYIVMNFMFTKFTPNDRQFKSLISCYKTRQYGVKYYQWIDILINKNHKFTKAQLELLNSIAYPYMHKILKNSKFTIETIKHFIIAMKQRKKNSLFEIQNQIDQCKEQLPQEYLELIINETDLYSLKYNDDIVISIINKSILTESIFEVIINKCIVYENIIYFLIKKILPNDKFITYLIDIHIFNKRLDILLELSNNGYNITVELLNKMIEKNEYCYYDIDIADPDVILSEQFSKLFEFNLHKSQHQIKKPHNDKFSDEENESFDNKDTCIVECSDEYSDDDSYSYDEIPLNKNNNIISILSINLFELYNLIPTFDTFLIVCRKSYCKFFDILVSNNKFVPTKECLDESMTNPNQTMIIKIICYKINPDKYTLKKLLANNHNIRKMEKIVELLIKNGLQLTLEEIDGLIFKSVIINDLNRFDIELNEEVYFICYKYDIYPSQYNDKYTIDKNVLTLREICRNKKTTVETVKKFIKTNNVKPDRYCIDSIFNLNNTCLITYFHDKLNCDPTVFSLIHNDIYKCNNIKSYQLLMNEILNKCEITYKIMSKSYDHIDIENLP